MLPYAAYLRVYEPLSAFEEPELSRWVAYAASPTRPRRRCALQAEYAETLRRIAAQPPVMDRGSESRDAYIRWAHGVTYVCPWQTRLRAWLALSHLRATLRPPLAGERHCARPSQPTDRQALTAHLRSGVPVILRADVPRAIGRAPALAGPGSPACRGSLRSVRISGPNRLLKVIIWPCPPLLAGCGCPLTLRRRCPASP